MYITWRQLSNHYYAYLVSSYWDKEKKAPRTTARYLGSSLITAQKNLEKHLSSLPPGQLASRAKIDLLAKLGEKAPDAVVNLPSRDRAKESVLRHLVKLKNHHAARSDLVFVLDRAIERLS